MRFYRTLRRLRNQNHPSRLISTYLQPPLELFVYECISPIEMNLSG